MPQLSNPCNLDAEKIIRNILNGLIPGPAKMADSKAETQRTVELEVLILVNPHMAYKQKKRLIRTGLYIH